MESRLAVREPTRETQPIPGSRGTINVKKMLATITDRKQAMHS